MNLTPDFSLIIQVILFIIVWVGVNRLAFEPTSKVLEERRRRTVAAEEQATAMVAGADTDRETYDATVRERRVQMAAETASARSEAQSESARVLEQARESANQALAAQRAAVADQVTAAHAQLAKDADGIAKEMLRRVTGGAA